jgi:hypothetical protein
MQVPEVKIDVRSAFWERHFVLLTVIGSQDSRLSEAAPVEQLIGDVNALRKAINDACDNTLAEAMRMAKAEGGSGSVTDDELSRRRAFLIETKALGRLLARNNALPRKHAPVSSGSAWTLTASVLNIVLAQYVGVSAHVKFGTAVKEAERRSGIEPDVPAAAPAATGLPSLRDESIGGTPMILPNLPVKDVTMDVPSMSLPPEAPAADLPLTMRTTTTTAAMQPPAGRQEKPAPREGDNDVRFKNEQEKLAMDWPRRRGEVGPQFEFVSSLAPEKRKRRGARRVRFHHDAFNKDQIARIAEEIKRLNNKPPGQRFRGDWYVP